MCPNARSNRVLMLSLLPSNSLMPWANRLSTINSSLTCSVSIWELNISTPSSSEMDNLNFFFHDYLCLKNCKGKEKNKKALSLLR